MLLEWVALVGMGVCAAGGFFFALAESALFSLGRWRAQQLAEEHPEQGEQILRLLQEPQDLLATIVLGNTFSNAGIVAIALWTGFAGLWPLAFAIPGALVLILVVGEVVPKTLAARAPERWALRLVRPVSTLKRATGPLRRIAQHSNAAILRAITPAPGRNKSP